MPRALLQHTLTGRWAGYFLWPPPSLSMPGEPSSKDWGSHVRPNSQDQLHNLPQLMHNENAGPLFKADEEFQDGTTKH